jgi:hypothetical protein
MTIQRHDWELVRIHYTQGRENGGGVEFPTLEQLGEEYAIPAPTIRSRAHREGWRQQRNNFHTQLVQKTREKTLEELSDKMAQANLQAFSVARAVLAVSGKQFMEGAQDGSLSLADRERLLRMCDLAHRMARRAAGMGEAE